MRVIYETVTALIAVDLDDLPLDLMEFWQKQWAENRSQLIDALARHEWFSVIHQWQPGTFSRGADRLIDVWLDCQTIVEAFYVEEHLDKRLELLSQLHDAMNLRVGSPKFYGGSEGLESLRAPLRKCKEFIKDVFAEIGDASGEADHMAARLLP